MNGNGHGKMVKGLPSSVTIFSTATGGAALGITVGAALGGPIGTILGGIAGAGVGAVTGVMSRSEPHHGGNGKPVTKH